MDEHLCGCAAPFAWDFLRLAELPRPAQLTATLLAKGFRYQETPLHCGFSISAVTQNLSIQELRALPERLARARDCALAVLDTYGGSTVPGNDADVVEIESNVFVGRGQQVFLSRLKEMGYSPRISSAYRSDPYQALLFAIHYLRGTLFDSALRYTVVPPPYSDHTRVDGALDTDDPILFSLFADEFNKQSSMPFSLSQPFLFHPAIAHEPWHFRCVHTPNGDRTEVLRCLDGPPRPNRRTAGAFLDYFSGRTSSLPAFPAFVTGISRSGALSCVGSIQPTTSKAIGDAFEAVGANWDFYYLTVLEGFTPLFDGDVLERDIGRCTFKIVSNEALDSAYLTGQGACLRRLLEPGRIVDALREKASISAEEPATLYKSRAEEALYSPTGAILRCQYGLPLTSPEHPDHTPALLASAFMRWLTHSAGEGLPPYLSYDYGRSHTDEFDFSRYAFLFRFLAANRDFLSRRLVRLEEQLAGVFMAPAAWGYLLRGEAIPGDETAETTAVLLTHALWLRGAVDEARALWGAQRQRICQRLLRAAAEDPLADALFVGHCADLGGACAGLLDYDVLSTLTEGTFLTRMCRASERCLIFAAPFASVIILALSHGASHAREAALNLFEMVLDFPSSPVEEERGAFLGWESFLTALPLEALCALRRTLRLTPGDDSLVLQRITDGIRFLRALQFHAGSGALTDHPSMLEGAVRFSLPDHHFRIDYGVHASQVAFAMLRREEARQQ